MVFGIIVIRFWFTIFEAFGVESNAAFGAAAWLEWVNTLLVAEVYIG